MLTLIVLLPLLGFLLNGLLATRLGGNRVGKSLRHRRRLRAADPVVPARRARLPRPARPAAARRWSRPPTRWARIGEQPLRDRVLLRPPERGDDADRHRRRLADPHLLDRLHEGRQELRALLRVPQPVPVLHAAAGARPLAAGAVRRLGRRRPRLLPADRLLVRGPGQGGAPARRRSSPTASATPASCSACSCSTRRFGTLDMDRINAAFAARRRAGGVGEPRRHPAVHRRHRQVGADSAARLAARRDGRPDAGVGADPRGDDGHRRRLPGRAHVAASTCTRPRRRR